MHPLINPAGRFFANVLGVLYGVDFTELFSLLGCANLCALGVPKTTNTVLARGIGPHGRSDPKNFGSMSARSAARPR